MNKKGKNCDFSENKKYANYPFNMMLNIYINNMVTHKKLNNEPLEGERTAYRQEVYEELSANTGIVVETIKNYSTGKSTPPVNTKLDEYKKFAKIFDCTISEILPETLEDRNNRLALLEKMGFEESSYNILRYKKQTALFGGPILSTYFDILNDIIFENTFLATYEKEIDTNMKKLLKAKNSNEELKSMSYRDFIKFLNEKEIYDLDDMKTKIVRTFEKQLDNFIKSKFDK